MFLTAKLDSVPKKKGGNHSVLSLLVPNKLSRPEHDFFLPLSQAPGQFATHEIAGKPVGHSSVVAGVVPSRDPGLRSDSSGLHCLCQ